MCRDCKQRSTFLHIRLMKNFFMKQFFIKTFIIVVVASLGLSAVMLIRKPIDLSVRQITTQKDSMFRVSDSGKVFVKPDTAEVTLAVIKEGKKVADVQKDLNQANSAVLKALKDLGIDDTYIKTVNYSITPNYRYVPTTGKSIIDGYRAEARLAVKVKDFDKVNKVIDAATSAGANEVGTVNFTVDARDEFVAQARAEAIQKAKAKAKVIADETGMQLGKIVDIQISENDGAPISPMYGGGYGGAMDIKASAPTEISVGENAISVTVTLVYETK